VPPLRPTDAAGDCAAPKMREVEFTGICNGFPRRRCRAASISAPSVSCCRPLLEPLGHR
jgi:hypothetical protein